MKTYLVKIVYQIICNNNQNVKQFDEQLRLIIAEDEFHAFQRGRQLGEREEDTLLNSKQKPVVWKFVDVVEVHLLNELSDGLEVYSQIREEEETDRYLEVVRKRASILYEKCLNENILKN